LIQDKESSIAFFLAGGVAHNRNWQTEQLTDGPRHNPEQRSTYFLGQTGLRPKLELGAHYNLAAGFFYFFGNLIHINFSIFTGVFGSNGSEGPIIMEIRQRPLQFYTKFLQRPKVG